MILKNLIENFAITFAIKSMQKALNDELKIELNFKELPQPKRYGMLYIHVPFCHTLCPYCSFHKYAYNKDIAKEYFKNLRLQLKKIKNLGFDFSTLYVGGGTTLIDEEELEKTLILIKNNFNITQISCESDPSHIDDLTRFKGLIDRLSVGVQSFNDEILKKIGRYEKFGSGQKIRDKLEEISQILPILSIDCIFNFPNQSQDELLYDIKMAKSTNANQFTFYPLMKSALTKDKISHSLGTSTKDNEREFYEIICKNMQEFYLNNVWSFSKTKNSNIKDEYVSSFTEYLGAGSGAFSFLDNKLFINAFDLNKYATMCKEGASSIIASCSFSKKNRAHYLLLTKLFDLEFNFKEFCKNNNIDSKILYFTMQGLKLSGAITKKGENIVLTDFGRYLVLVLMKEFYTGMDKLREVFRQNNKYSGKIHIMQNKNFL